MAQISRRRLAETTVRLLRAQPVRRQHILQAVAAYLIENKQAKYLDLFIGDVARELQATESQLYAEVTSAHPLDDQARQELIAYLKRATSTKEIELDEQVDSDLLAGVVVRTPDQALDTSARYQLQRLSHLNSGGDK